MAKKQTRRAVSLKEDSYRKVSTYCEVKGISRSAFLEELIDAFFKQREPSFTVSASSADTADRGTPGRPKGPPAPKAKPEPPRGGGVHTL